MYSISGLPLLVSSAPLSTLAGAEVMLGIAPLPTASRVAGGTLVTSCATLAGRAVPAGEPADGVGVLEWSTRAMISTATTASTTITLPPVMTSRRRASALRAASRCAAIFSRALRSLILLALPIVRPQSQMILSVILPQSMVGRGGKPGGRSRTGRRPVGAASLPRQPEDKLKTGAGKRPAPRAVSDRRPG